MQELQKGSVGKIRNDFKPDLGSTSLKCNSLHYNHYQKHCITLQLQGFDNVMNYIRITSQSKVITLQLP